MTSHVSIAEAGSLDSESVARIIRESFADVAIHFGLTPENCPSHPSNCTVEWIRSDQKRGRQYFILLTDSTAVGCVGLELPDRATGHVFRLAVLPSHRNAGHGRALMDHVVARAKEAGATRVRLEIIAAHEDLKAWYLLYGFRVVETARFSQVPFEVCFMEMDTVAGAG